MMPFIRQAFPDNCEKLIDLFASELWSERVKITPTDPLNLSDWKSYDIINLITPKMISINHN